MRFQKEKTKIMVIIFFESFESFAIVLPSEAKQTISSDIIEK